MKKLLLGAAALVALAGSAIAADMPIKAAPVVAAPGCAQFGGFYLGGNAGWKYRNHDWTDKDGYGGVLTLGGFDVDPVARSGSLSSTSWEAGVQSGYNFQWHCTVWGIQGDWNWTNAKVSSIYTHPDFDPAFAGNSLSYSSKENWFGTLRTRSGVVVDNLLLYVTGGIAWANFDRNLAYSFNPSGGITPFAQSFNSSKTRLGFAVGAGTEWAWSQNWSVVSEILYMGFEKDTPSYTCLSGITCRAGSAPYRYEFRDNEWVARLGVNYRFGGGAAPVLANY